MNHKENAVNNGPMLNAYVDSIGGKLSDIIAFIKQPELAHTFQSFYILPSIFNTDLDRGFSVIDYNLNELYADEADLRELKDLGINLKLDFILNHASVLSKQFQDILKHGEESDYVDFFIDWNKFWQNNGTMTEEGYIQPNEELIKDMFFRKPGMPILMVRFPDGREVPYWNTFYQEIQYEFVNEQNLMRAMDIQYTSALDLAQIINEGIRAGIKPGEIELGRYGKYQKEVIEILESNRKYLGQMDLNIKSTLVWEYYDETLSKLASYGSSIVRLDAFAYAPKEPGQKNFLNEPGTWDLLENVQKLADKYELELLPEIHASYDEKIYERLAEKGYMTYDFFLPGLLIDALENRNLDKIIAWENELTEKNIRVVNMLGCHDGIPLLDLKGIIEEDEIQRLIDIVVSRGGYVKNLHGQKNIYYQVNATYYSALGEDDKKMLLARALQIFMPGKPQVWYLDLLAGKNDHEAVKRAGAGGHKEINRTNLSLEEIDTRLKEDVVKKQIEMLRFRNEFPAFGFDAEFLIHRDGKNTVFSWEKNGHKAVLEVDIERIEFRMFGIDNKKEYIWL